MKMVLQVHRAEDDTRRTRFFTVRGGYHGDTFSPMSVTDPEGGMHSLFTGILPQHVFAPRPPAGLEPDPEAMSLWENETRALYAQHADEIAGVIVEPVLQGAGGMHVYSPYAVQVLADLARSSGALLVLDEIATGFHRTGTPWAMDRCGVVPDVLCVGKALTGGYLSLAAVLCTTDVARRVSGGEAGGLMHGPTFMANPLACAVANANLDLLVSGDAPARVAAVEAGLENGLADARDVPGVADVRVLGAVGVVQLDHPVDVAAASAAALAEGVWVRPFRDLIYTMPPYTCTEDEIATITRALLAAARVG